MNSQWRDAKEFKLRPEIQRIGRLPSDGLKFLQIAELAEADSPRIYTDVYFKEPRFKQPKQT